MRPRIIGHLITCSSVARTGRTRAPRRRHRPPPDRLTCRQQALPFRGLPASSRTLATLRKAFHADVKSRIIAEIDKDLTKHPVTEIEKHITNGIL